MIGASSKVIPYRYAHLLHVYYSLLSLDKVKDWVLDYPAEARRPENPFGTKHPMASDDFYKEVLGSAFAKYTTGLNSSPGVHSIAHRPVFSSLVEAYLCCYKEMTEKQRKSVEALFLLGGYVNTLEAMNAVRTCLCGTPNMSADGWSVPMQMAFLFPEHEMASEWADFFEKMIELKQLDEVLPCADAVILCLPSNEETNGFFTHRLFSLMKEDAIFVNVGRGSLVALDDVAEALNSKSIGGAILDVTQIEPLPQDHPLWDCENLILTPHVAGTFANEASFTQFEEIVMTNLRNYHEGKPLINERHH